MIIYSKNVNITSHYSVFIGCSYYEVKRLTDRITCSISMEGLYFIVHFIKGHHTAMLITLIISVIEASYLQF